MSIEIVDWLAVALGLLSIGLSAWSLFRGFKSQGTWELTSASASAAIRTANRAHESASLAKGAVDAVTALLAPPWPAAAPAAAAPPVAAVEAAAIVPAPSPESAASAPAPAAPVQSPVPNVAPASDWEARFASMHARMDTLLTLQERLAAAALAPAASPAPVPAPVVLAPAVPVAVVAPL